VTTKPKVALITGITGQDGSYLAEFLLEKGYIVHGIKRRASLFNTQRVDHIYQDPHVDNARFKMHYGDLSDTSNLVRIIQETQPDEIYNLGAMSHVAVSFESPEYTADVVGIGTLRILEAIRILGLEKKTRFYQASTSELYGLVQEIPQKETTPFYPRSPYAVAKLYAYWIVVNYREAYGMYACNGICTRWRASAISTFMARARRTKGRMSSIPFHFNNQIIANGVCKLFAGTDGYGDGEQQRDFVFVEDAASVNLWFFDHPDKSGIFNLGTGRAQPFNDVARAVVEWHKEHRAVSTIIEYIPFPEHLKGAYQSYTQADISALRAAGYDGRFHSVEEGVNKYLNWLNAGDSTRREG